MAARKRGTPGDIDQLRNALRPRMLLPSSGGGSTVPTTIPPHTHHASEIIAEPEPVTALLSGDDVQEDLEELGVEKLARSGEQAWVGPAALDMNHFDVTNVRDQEIESDLTMSGPVGEAIIDGPRVVHMAGDHTDDEAKIDGLERVVFNDEVTASSIEEPSRIDFNVEVTAPVNVVGAEVAGDYALPGGVLLVDPEPDCGTVSWDTLEDILIVQARLGDVYSIPLEDSEPQHGPVAVGWGVRMAINTWSPV